jgi:hypothetical protein
MTDRYLAGAAGGCPAFADDVSGDGDCQADGAEADPASACVELGSQEGGAPVCYYYEPYSKPHLIAKKKSPRAASYASR